MGDDKTRTLPLQSTKLLYWTRPFDSFITGRSVCRITSFTCSVEGPSACVICVCCWEMRTKLHHVSEWFLHISLLEIGYRKVMGRTNARELFDSVSRDHFKRLWPRCQGFDMINFLKIRLCCIFKVGKGNSSDVFFQRYSKPPTSRASQPWLYSTYPYCAS